MASKIPTPDVDLSDFTPTVEDWALHGRAIHQTPYATLWRQALALMASFSTGTMYLGLRDSDVRFSMYRSPTACINIITKDIYINPTFLRKWALTPQDLAFVLMHELMHPLIDPENKNPVTNKYNICSDALINSIIFRISPTLSSLPRKFYKADIFPGCLLRSGVSKTWRKAVSEYPGKTIIQDMTVPPQRSHVDIYTSLYPSSRRSSSALRPSIDSLISTFFEQDAEGGDEGTDAGGTGGTLGGYAPNNRPEPGDEKKLSDEDFEQIKAIAEEFDSSKKARSVSQKSLFDKADNVEDVGPDQDGNPDKSAGKSGDLKTFWAQALEKEQIFQDSSQITKEDKIRWAYETIKGINPYYAANAFGAEGDYIRSKVDKVKELYINDGIIESFILSSQNDVRGELVDLLSFKKTSKRTVVPGKPTRQGYAFLAHGFNPLYYRKKKSVKEEARKNSVVYVDFSGSMGTMIKWLMVLIPFLEKRCNSDIWVFSTEIVKSSSDLLRQGIYSTTGGTSFDSVVEHAVNYNEDAHNFLMITDGCDSLSTKSRQLLAASGKNAYMLIVENHTPSATMVKSHQEWCTRVFLKEKKWWDELKLSPIGRR